MWAAKFQSLFGKSFHETLKFNYIGNDWTKWGYSSRICMHVTVSFLCGLTPNDAWILKISYSDHFRTLSFCYCKTDSLSVCNCVCNIREQMAPASFSSFYWSCFFTPMDMEKGKDDIWLSSGWLANWKYWELTIYPVLTLLLFSDDFSIQ